MPDLDPAPPGNARAALRGNARAALRGDAHAALRAATAPYHEAVDAAFARFDLGDRASYARFLIAHARALPAVEAALAGDAATPPLRPRTPLLRDDLAAMGEAMPPPLDFAPPADAAEAFGMRYVIEGSRLGGRMLARGVGAGLPSAYLGDIHLPGEWRGFAAALDGAADGAAWIAAAEAAAARTFALYGEAARADRSTMTSA